MKDMLLPSPLHCITLQNEKKRLNSLLFLTTIMFFLTDHKLQKYKQEAMALPQVVYDQALKNFTHQECGKECDNLALAVGSLCSLQWNSKTWM